MTNKSPNPLTYIALSLIIVSCEVQSVPPPTSPVANAPAAVATEAAARSCDLAVGNREVVVSATRRAQLGLDYWPDGPLGVVRDPAGYTFYGFNAPLATKRTGIARTVGSLDDPVASVTAVIPIQDPKGDYDYYTANRVYRDSRSGALLGFSYYERNPHGDPSLFYSGVGLVKSTDNGMTWRDLGLILGAEKPYDPNATRNVSFWGAPVVVGAYFYFYFEDTAASGSPSWLGVARARVEEVVRSAVDANALAPWTKYYNGAWSEPGLGGRSSPLLVKGQGPPSFRQSVGASAASVQPHGASYNEYLHKYLLVIQQYPLGARSDELHLLESTDGLIWENEHVIESERPLANNATIIGTGSDPLVSGSAFYVYYAYFPTFPVNSWSDAVLARRLVSCEPTARAKTTLAVDIGVNLADDTQTATVTLTDGSARPVVGASVELTWTPLEGRGTRATYQTTGVVPAGYSKALVQVNYNQNVLRPGPIDLALYDVRYGEAGAAPRTIPNGAFAEAMSGWYASEPGTVQIARDNDGTRSLVISASASQSGLVNGSPFQVTPGAAYVFEISARVAGSSADRGGFALIFLKDVEGSRKTIPFASARIGARGLTDSAGQFRLAQLPKTRVRVEARYEGDVSHWPAEYAWAER